MGEIQTNTRQDWDKRAKNFQPGRKDYAHNGGVSLGLNRFIPSAGPKRHCDGNLELGNRCIARRATKKAARLGRVARPLGFSDLQLDYVVDRAESAIYLAQADDLPNANPFDDETLKLPLACRFPASKYPSDL